jgi:glycosyltransferase involved in cell wall biosynthesis
VRIALLAPLVSPIAPPYLGGAQALLADLAAGLAARGHDVTLYAADGSHVPGVRTPALGIDAALLRPARFAEGEGDSEGGAEGEAEREDGDEEGPNALAADPEAFRPVYAFARAFRAIAAAAEAGEHDLLHAHAYDWPAYAHANLQPLPVVHTLHLPPLDPAINDVLRRLAPPGEPSATRLVTVSRACAEAYAPVCRIDAVIYNGVAVERIPFGARPDPAGYLLYAGRITPEKGVEDALEIAARAGRPLLLAGGVYDQAYYERRIAPRLAAAGGDGAAATYLGALDRERLWALMAGAAAVLCPVRWDEPFGLVACEAQAAGAPVIGYARGGLREVVADGATGWLAPPGDVDAAVAAVARLGALDRAACRARAERLFGLGAMLDGYEAFYAGMLGRDG